MKVKDHPMVRYGLVKDFEVCTLTPFVELTEEQKEYEIIATTTKTIRGDKNRVYVIASPQMMKEWNLKPKQFRMTARQAILGL
jgi:hypothetical protein